MPPDGSDAIQSANTQIQAFSSEILAHNNHMPSSRTYHSSLKLVPILASLTLLSTNVKPATRVLATHPHRAESTGNVGLIFPFSISWDYKGWRFTSLVRQNGNRLGVRNATNSNFESQQILIEAPIETLEILSENHLPQIIEC